MTTIQAKKTWPPIPGDFEIRNEESCVAVCTLGKKIEVDAEYAIIGTCKTENIGIERMIVNIISNPRIRYFILAGPEVPGHRTGSSLLSLYENGVEAESRKIVNAPGAIPYIENVPLEGVERFREQVDLINMMNNSDIQAIEQKVAELNSTNMEVFPAEAIWIDFAANTSQKPVQELSGPVSLLPEYGRMYDASSALVYSYLKHAIVSKEPSQVSIQMKVTDTGTTLYVKEE